MKIQSFMKLSVAVLLLVVTVTAQAWDMASPERLSYTVRWLGISAGSAELYYAPQPTTSNTTYSPANSYTITVRAWTGPAVRWAYHVRDRIIVKGQHSIALPFATHSYQLEQVENDHRGDKILNYERNDLQLEFRNKLAQEAPRYKPMPAQDVRDLISILYQLRTELTDITPGKQWSYTMYDLTRPHKLTITAVAPSTVNTPIGTFDAYELVLRQNEIGGGGKVTEGLRIWVSTGPQKLPLKFAIDLPFGSFIARLEGVGRYPADSSQAQVAQKFSKPPQNLPLTGPIPALEKAIAARAEEDPPNTLANPYTW